MRKRYFTVFLGALAAITLGILPGLSAVAKPLTGTNHTVATMRGAHNGQKWSGDIATIRHLTGGTITVRFTTSQTSGVGVLFSASDRNVDSRNLTLAVSKGHLYWEVRDNEESAYKAKIDAEDAYVADGQPHTVTVIVGKQGTSIYLDGVQVYSATSTAFFAALSEITDVTVGANIDNHGAQWQLQGTVESAKVTADYLSSEQIQQSAPLPSAVLTVKKGSTSVNEVAHQILSSGAFTLQTRIQNNTDQNANLATLYRDSTAVAILSYNKNSLLFAMGGKRLTVPGKWSDREHIITITISADKVIIYADGTYVASGKLPTHGLPTVTAISSTQETQLFASILPNALIERLSGYSRPTELALYDAGYMNSASYRIPSLLHTTKGTLIAGADQRVASAKDSPNDINFVIRRSHDGGKTWSGIQKLIDLPGEGRQAASTIDSVLLQNPKTGTITAVVDVFPGGIGQPNNVAGIGQNSDGTLKLFTCDRHEYKLQHNGVVTTTKGESTQWHATSNGDLYRGEEKVGNYYSPLRDNCDTNSLHLLDTSFLIVLQSKDDGETWSEPKYINHDVKESWMYFLGTGPGAGIVIDSGAYRGRLVVPVYYSNQRKVYSSAVIYSDDDGKTWHRGASPNDERLFNGEKVGSRNLTQHQQSLHEATVVQSGTDELTLFMRNLNPGSRIAVARSADGGATWSAPKFDPNVPNAFSQPNAFSIGPNHQTVVFANAGARLPYRGRGVIWISHDGARTWSQARTINPGHYVYQSMVPMSDGSIALLWEREWQGLYFSTIPAGWLAESPVNSIK